MITNAAKTWDDCYSAHLDTKTGLSSAWHCIVPAGGINKSGELTATGKQAVLLNPKIWQQLEDKLYKTNCVVNC
jgi:hypothetical protein